MGRATYFPRDMMENALRLLSPPNRLVMECVLHTGRRIGDILAIRTEQLRSTTIWITEQKTGKRSKIQLPGVLLQRIRDQAGSIWAFPGRSDPTKHRTRQAVWYDLRRAQKALRLPGALGTHSGRKLYAVELMKRWGDLERVRADLKHSNAAITIVYAMADKIARNNVSKKGRGRKK